MAKIVPKSIITEASGMITKETIHEYAKSGVDYISLGYLTHSVKAFDISANVTINTTGGIAMSILHYFEEQKSGTFPETYRI